MADVVGLTANVLKRVVRVVIGSCSGTAFTMDVDGRHYLITAKHVVATLKDGDATIKVCGDGGQCEDTVVTVLRCADPIDIAVLVPRKLLTVTFSLPADSAGMVLGQDVYFVGFPYADPVLNTVTPALENIGFVRKAVWSAHQQKDNAKVMYFDGRNNAGFSGSPIVYLQQGKPGYDFKVAGVVSGFRSDFTEVIVPKPIAEKDVTDEDRATSRVVRAADGTLEAVKLVRERGVSVAQAGRDLGVHENVLRKWVKEFGSDPVQAFPGHGQMKPEQLEIERLRREVTKLKAERDILKKAAAYFAKEVT